MCDTLVLAGTIDSIYVPFIQRKGKERKAKVQKIYEEHCKILWMALLQSQVPHPNFVVKPLVYKSKVD